MNLTKHVIIVGKVNVGKSTLFNALSGLKISIAHKTRGATRDCIERDTVIGDRTITFVDSGGMEDDESNKLQSLITTKVYDFMKKKASLIIFVVDVQTGITAQDATILAFLRKQEKPVILVVNKVDNEALELDAAQFYSLGFNDVLFISASQAQGLHYLRELIVKRLNQIDEESSNGKISLLKLLDDVDIAQKEEDALSIAVLGKPNAGKSTFINAILDDEVVLTSPIAGTTLDAIDTKLSYKNKKITLIDTAGIRRKKNIEAEIEKMAVAKSLCAADRANISLLLIDAKLGTTEQDVKIAGLLSEKKRAVIIVVNKWDEQTKSEQDKNSFIEELNFKLPFLAYAPIIFISSKYKQNIFAPIDKAFELNKKFSSVVNTSKLNRVVEKAQDAHPLPMVGQRRAKLFFARQVASQPPTIIFTCNYPSQVHFSYKRYLMNFLRDHLDLKEIPLRFSFKGKNFTSMESGIEKDV